MLNIFAPDCNTCKKRVCVGPEGDLISGNEGDNLIFTHAEKDDEKQ